MYRDSQGLTCLSTLVLDSCSSMISLSFDYVPHLLPALQTINIRYCDDLASLDGFRNLGALRELVVANCYSFCSLPADLNSVGSLNKLAICHCPLMRFLPQDGLPASMQTILLSNCAPDLDSELQRKEGAEWEKIVHIPEKKLEVYAAFHSLPIQWVLSPDLVCYRLFDLHNICWSFANCAFAKSHHFIVYSSCSIVSNKIQMVNWCVLVLIFYHLVRLGSTIYWVYFWPVLAEMLHIYPTGRLFNLKLYSFLI